MTLDAWKCLLDIETSLASQLASLNYSEKVEYVYNPLDYALTTHKNFLAKYASRGPKPVLFLGMNPGPWGMAQTGVPFGEVQHVKNWLEIEGEVGKPAKEHPKKLITGLHCKRREVSGDRFWTFVKSNCSAPDAFFRNCIVYNHCPLLYMNRTGKNLTPPDLGKDIRNTLYKLCDAALKTVLQLYEVQHVIGIGRFAEMRAKKVIEENKMGNIKVHFMVHPSPASAMANKGWDQLAYNALKASQLFNTVFDQ